MSVRRAQAHWDEGLRCERVSFEYANVQQLALIISVPIVVVIELEVAPAARHALARFMRAQIPGRAHEHVHDGSCGFLAWRKVVEIRHV